MTRFYVPCEFYCGENSQYKMPFKSGNAGSDPFNTRASVYGWNIDDEGSTYP